MEKTTFTSKINGNDIYAKRAEATRSGVNLETYTPTGGTEHKGILPDGLKPGHEGTNDANILATQQYVKDAFSVADALVYKGALAGGSTGAYGALTPAATKGDVYKVSNAGKIDGIAVEVGDMLICNSDNTDAATAENYSTIAGKWDVIQVNIDGAVVGPASAVDGNIALFDGTTGKTIKNGANLALSNSPASKAIVTNAQGAIVDADLSTAAPSASGDTLAFIDSVSQDSQGKITATKKSVTVDSTYSASGTNPVNGTAVTAALATLDADVTSTDGTNVQVKVTEVDGKVTAVNITSDTTAANDHVHGQISNDGKIGSTANLAVVTTTAGEVTTADMTTSSPTATSDEVLEFIDTVSQDSKGQISATKKKVKVVSTYSGTGTEPVNGTAVKAAIDTLYVTEVGGAGKYVSAISETDGKIAPTVTTMDTTPTASSTNAVTSGGVKTYVDDALDALDATESGTSNGITVGVTQTNGKIVDVSVTATPATAGGAAGLVSYDTVEL